MEDVEPASSADRTYKPSKEHLFIISRKLSSLRILLKSIQGFEEKRKLYNYYRSAQKGFRSLSAMRGKFRGITNLDQVRKFGKQIQNGTCRSLFLNKRDMTLYI